MEGRNCRGLICERKELLVLPRGRSPGPEGAERERESKGVGGRERDKNRHKDYKRKLVLKTTYRENRECYNTASFL